MDCGAGLEGTHRNRKRCEPCAQARRTRPASTLTEEQRAGVREAAGRVPQRQLAEQLGCSVASLRRFCRDEGLGLRVPAYSPLQVAQVLAAYEAGGKHAAAEAFPGLKVRSIIERYAHAARQTRFTDEDVRVLARLGGLVPWAVQAAYMDRPNAHEGSIHAFWQKRMPCPPTVLLGMPRQRAWAICEREVPVVSLPPMQGGSYGRRTVLWCDAELYLLPWVPAFLQQAVATMAAFQRWLYDDPNPTAVVGDIVAWGEARARTCAD